MVLLSRKWEGCSKEGQVLCCLREHSSHKGEQLARGALLTDKGKRSGVRDETGARLE